MAISTPDVEDAVEHAAGPRRRGLLGRAVTWPIRWVQADQVRRGPHLLAPATYGLAALAHGYDVPAWPGLALTALATIGSYTRAMNRPGDDTAEPVRVALASAVVGTWLTAATEFGVTAGPYGLMGWLAAGAYGLTYWAYRKDTGVREALAWQRALDEWHANAPRYGLAGSHLVDRRETRLGEQLEIDTKGTGRRASALVGPGLEELIAEQESLPTSRVKTRKGAIAGRLKISIRYKNPWAETLPHPLLDPAPEIPLPSVADIREPLIIGMDPETGKPLQIPLWDEDGAKRLMIVAITRGGKTVLLSNILERLTAADNVFTIGINVSKAREMRRWRPALGASACGPDERVKALRILEVVRDIIDWRGAQDSDDAVLIPRQSRPAVAVVIDEMDTLVGQSDNLGMALRRAVNYVVSKGGSEGVTVAAAGQRGVVSHFGSGDIKRMFDLVAMLKSSSEGEIRHVLGEIGLTMPNMMAYGEGNPGVVLTSDLAGHWEAGRTWFLKELPDIDRLVVDRSPCPLEPELVEYLGDKLTAITQIEQPAPRRPRRPAPVSAPAPEAAMPTDDTIDKAAAQRATARARLAQATTPTMEGLSPGQVRAAAIERRRQAAEQTDINPELRALLLRLLAHPDGTTTRDVETAMQTELAMEVGVSKTGAWRCLDKLRVEGLAEIRGKGRGRRWHLAVPADGGGVPVDVPPMDDVDHERAVEVIEEEAAEAAEEELADTEYEHAL